MLSVLRKQANVLGEELLRLRKDEEAKNCTLEEKEKELAQKEASKVELQGVIEEMKARHLDEIAMVRAELTLSKREAATRMKEVSTVKSRLRKSEEDNCSLREEIRKLMERLANANAHTCSLHMRHMESAQEIKDLKARLMASAQSLDTMTAEKNQLQVELEGSRQRVESMEKEKAVSTDDEVASSGLGRMLQTKDDELKVMQSKLAAARLYMRAADKDITEKGARVRELEKALVSDSLSDSQKQHLALASSASRPKSAAPVMKRRGVHFSTEVDTSENTARPSGQCLANKSRPRSGGMLPRSGIMRSSSPMTVPVLVEKNGRSPRVLADVTNGDAARSALGAVKRSRPQSAMASRKPGMSPLGAGGQGRAPRPSTSANHKSRMRSEGSHSGEATNNLPGADPADDGYTAADIRAVFGDDSVGGEEIGPQSPEPPHAPVWDNDSDSDDECPPPPPPETPPRAESNRESFVSMLRGMIVSESENPEDQSARTDSHSMAREFCGNGNGPEMQQTKGSVRKPSRPHTAGGRADAAAISLSAFDDENFGRERHYSNGKTPLVSNGGGWAAVRQRSVLVPAAQVPKNAPCPVPDADATDPIVTVELLEQATPGNLHNSLSTVRPRSAQVEPRRR